MTTTTREPERETTAREPERETTAMLPGFEFAEDITEAVTAPVEDSDETVTSETGAWTATQESDQATQSETAADVSDEGTDPKDEIDPDETATVRVLIVDDETAMCAMTSAIVESMGYVPITVPSGEEAIETYRQHRDRNEAIQVIVMDLALPGGMSGLEATDALREIDEKVRVIASSGYLQQNARTAAIERGFAGILPKPYTAERLTAELRWVVKHE